jgi:tripartite-type tricarboxylate transporter receptor subunit TctC
MKKLAFILVAAIAAFFSAAAHADDYPSRPVTIVNVFGPGSGSDTVSRIIADKLGPALGQTIIVEDRPGADGAAGRALRPSSAGGRLYAPDGNQLAAVCRSVHTQELEL